MRNESEVIAKMIDKVNEATALVADPKSDVMLMNQTKGWLEALDWMFARERTKETTNAGTK